jgi:hypothetical protein
MTNSESLGAESATEPTTKPESADLNMSAGAEMLIERMKTNPEDFKYGGKFYRVVEAIQKQGQGWISPRDQLALQNAHSEHIQEAEFSEWVYGEIFTPKEEETPAGYQRAYTQNLAGSMMQAKNALAAQTLNGMFGTQAMTMSSNGNLGVGTSTGANSLSVGAAGSTTALTVAGTSGQQLMTVDANSGNPTVTLGKTVLTESMLGQIKNKLGL